VTDEQRKAIEAGERRIHELAPLALCARPAPAGEAEQAGDYEQAGAGLGGREVRRSFMLPMPASMPDCEVANSR
jgi:hypothetical protein